MARPVARGLQTAWPRDVAAATHPARRPCVLFDRHSTTRPSTAGASFRFISASSSNPRRPCWSASTPHQTRRGFTASSSCRAAARMAAPSLRGQAMPSMAQARRKQQQELMQSGHMPDDLGLIPVTMVMPTGRLLPGFRAAFQTRWRLEKKRLRQRLVELVQASYFHLVQIRPRSSLRGVRADATRAARELYEEVYAAFAANRLDEVRDRACAGFLTSLRARAGSRPPNVRLHWTLHRHVRAPRVVSYKAVLLPSPKDAPKTEQNGMQQVVVRLHTMQTLRHLRLQQQKDHTGMLRQVVTQIDHRGEPMAGDLPTGEQVPPDAKESVEYFVVQRTLRKGEWGPWMAWGMTEETPLEVIEKKEKEYQAMLKANRAAA